MLYVLADLKFTHSKTYVSGCIRMWNLFAFADEDLKPYPSVAEKGGDEPRWMTLVAFARQDCVDRAWMAERGRNQWCISATGKDLITNLLTRCASTQHDVRHGYLWTPKFKKILCPTYEPSDKDAKRPWGSIYDDTKYSAIMDALD